MACMYTYTYTTHNYMTHEYKYKVSTRMKAIIEMALWVIKTLVHCKYVVEDNKP